MMMMKLCLEERGLKFNFERNQFIIFVKRRIAFFSTDCNLHGLKRQGPGRRVDLNRSFMYVGIFF